MLRRLGAGPALLLGLLGWLACSPPAAALDFGEGAVLVFADRLAVDSAANVISAEGHVEVVRADRRLLADELRYDQDTDQMEALGNVALVEPTGEILYADRVVLSGDLKNGLAEQLRGRLTDNSLLAASGGQFIDGTQTVLDRAVYSPCPLCATGNSPPLWQLNARRIEHDQETKDITYHHAFLEMHGIPVFYTPYFSHPDPTVERRSGFLSPSFGTSKQLGQFLQTPYYFALAPNYDVTLAPIFTTKENAVLAAEYRHLLESGRYELAGSATYATEAGSNANPTPSEEAFRGHLQGEGRFSITRDSRWGYDLAVTTDNTYLQRYKFSNENVLTNRLFAERVWQRNYASVNAYAFQGLRSFDHQQEIPFALPLAEAEMTSAPMRWGSRFTLNTNLLALTQVDGLDTRRLSVGGGWEVPYLGPLGDEYRLSLSLRGDVYNTDGNPQTFGSNDGENVTGRVIPRLTADWRWPWIGDTFGLTPLIEPVASFTWAVNDPNPGDIPNEDSQDLEFDDSNLFEPSRFAGTRSGRGWCPDQLWPALCRRRRRGRGAERAVRPELPLQRRQRLRPQLRDRQRFFRLCRAHRRRARVVVPGPLPLPPQPGRPEADPQRGRRGGRPAADALRPNLSVAQGRSRARPIPQAGRGHRRRRDQPVAVDHAARADPAQPGAGARRLAQVRHRLPAPVPRSGRRRRAALHQQRRRRGGHHLLDPC